MIDNYPPGSNTKDAPWNQKDPVDCPACDGHGKIPDDPEPSACPECKGDGFQEEDEE